MDLAARLLGPLACAAWLFAAHPARAQNAPQGGQPPGPPPEAIAACSGKAEGAAVTVALRDGKSVAATCRTMRGQLAELPDQPPGNPPPPPR